MNTCRLFLIFVIWVWSGVLAWAQHEQPRLLADIAPGEASSGGQTIQPKLLVIEGDVWFSAFRDTNELWKTDGSPEGTIRVSSVDGSVVSGISLGNKILFVQIRRNALIAVDRETLAIEELAGEFIRIVPWLYRMEEHVYFACTFEGTLFSLCRTDGTVEGTVRISTPSGISAIPVSAGRLGNSLLAMYESSLGAPMLLQVSGDDTTASLVRQFSNAWSVANVCCTTATTINGEVVFTLLVRALTDERYWISDGSEGGTRELLLQDGSEYSVSSSIVSLDQVFYGVVQVDHSSATRWVVGDSAGISYAFEGAMPFLASRLLPFSENEFLAVASSSLSEEDQVWVSDGSRDGTRLVHDLTDGENSGFIWPQGAIMVDDPFVVAAVSTLELGNNSLFLELDPRLGRAFQIGVRGSGAVSHVPVLLDENVILFADFADYGFEPAVIRTSETIGKVFVDSFEAVQP